MSLVVQTAFSEKFWPVGLRAARVVILAAARSGLVRVPAPSSLVERKERGLQDIFESDENSSWK